MREPGAKTSLTVHAHVHPILPSTHLQCIYLSTHFLHLLLPWEVGGISCIRKIVPVGEGRAKVITTLTDIQLLATPIMLGRAGGWEGRKEGRKEGNEREREGRREGGGRNEEEGRNGG